MGANFSASGVNIAAGTLDVSANNCSVSVRNYFSPIGGTFNARQGTLYFLGSYGGHTWNPGSANYYDVSLTAVKLVIVSALTVTLPLFPIT